MKFELTERQINLANEFKMTFAYEPTAIGGGFTYCFTPTSIGVIIKLKHASGKQIDLTEDL